MALIQEKKTLVAGISGSLFNHDTGAGKRHFSILPLRPRPPACPHQCWDTSGQAASWAGTQLHPPAGQQVLSPEPLQDLALSTRGPKTNHGHQRTPRAL